MIAGVRDADGGRRRAGGADEPRESNKLGPEVPSLSGPSGIGDEVASDRISSAPQFMHGHSSVLPTMASTSRAGLSCRVSATVLSFRARATTRELTGRPAMGLGWVASDLADLINSAD